MKHDRRLRIAAGMLAAGIFPAVSGARPLPEAAERAAEIERRQEHELEAQRARASERPDVLPSAAPFTSGLALPAETPCFTLREVAWDGPRPAEPLAAAASTVAGQCVGALGLRALQEHLLGLLIDRGLVTARIVVPEQSLVEGRLTLRYLPGRLSAVRSEGGIGWWRMALPTGPGGDLNQRDLDQALENIRRLGSQADASIDVAPGPQPGDSDIVIHPGAGKRWHGYLGGDNAGLDAIGKYQVNAGLTLDSPLFLYDQLSLSWNSNARWRDGQSNTRAASLNYSIPFGYWAFFVGASKSTYRQAVAGFDEPILYGGATRQVQAGVSLVPYRGAAYKGTSTLTLLRKRTTSTLDDVDIEVQRRDVTGYAFSLAHRHYLGRAMLDAGGGVRGTLAGLSEKPGYVYGDPDWNGRSVVLTASAGLHWPFRLADQPWTYQANWHIQHARTSIVPSDFLTIGNRYAVRGFDGQMTLASEDGWTLRNDLSLGLETLLRAPGQQLYAGLDVGRVGGPSAASLSGRTLVGAVAGLRGRVGLPYVNASYDLSAGWPLQKPESLKTASTVFAAALMFEL
ncbi:Hemolysin transporter protein ShlB [Achromobacter insolitus]|uniref:ShlB/FhaC/HecB family hemolysin secretion/activation protein n=1 Tax=Achromobacter insolitus TaxID=217204 RepID=UPI0014667E00|nr:ShlB/FhaC/HecB family hemolysin secretion/activation protein [Achromobacter insolitus]CAB3952094.1 Hemolysin transporter protein ShlB [Achromobacter insolitus]